jgi:hypothetical protein
MPRPMPPTGVMLSTHTLAHEIVTRNKNEVFEDRWLDLLERFVVDPERKEEMMEEYGWVDESGAKPGLFCSVLYGCSFHGEVLNSPPCCSG